MTTTPLILWFEQLRREDVPIVGGKNASLGELLAQLSAVGIRVPPGFATHADVFRRFLQYNRLKPLLSDQLSALERGTRSLSEVGSTLRQAIYHGNFPPEAERALLSAYRELSEREGVSALSVAVRSSATAEDLPEASFAGQQESYLNVQGERELLDACRKCFASLFTDRALNYRKERGYDQLAVALSVGVQKMVRSDRAGAGVMFSLDADSGFPDLVLISATWGLGETVVQGMVEPDEYRVWKKKLQDPSLKPILSKTRGKKQKKLIYAVGGAAKTKLVDTSVAEQSGWVLSDDEILTLARWAARIEEHYGTFMDMEWAKDALSGALYCVQARPETVQSRKAKDSTKSYRLVQSATPILSGIAVGDSIARGSVKILRDIHEMDRFNDGDVLVAARTDPDWGPIMKRASAIITDHGGRTSHAAIVSRELGVPAVVGTETATRVLREGQMVTVSCAEGTEGRVYPGALEFEERQIHWQTLPQLPVQLMINVASPETALRWWRLPVQGIGLARMEFVISEMIKIHPMALLRFEEVLNPKERRWIEELTHGYAERADYFVDILSRALAAIAASQYPHPAIVRMSDFKTNEYGKLIGGSAFEPHEENPMLGFRGACRYYSPRYRQGFALECRAVKKAREELGLDNIAVMIPFVRTLDEADKVIQVLAENGLVRGRNGLVLYMMCEVPSNVLLVERFAERFDGFSIGSNDLTQLTLGVDRDAEELRSLFDERNEAVRLSIAQVIDRAHRVGSKVGICGQAPSDHPDFARFLIDEGIDSISLNPDSVMGAIEAFRASAEAPASAKTTAEG